MALLKQRYAADSDDMFQRLDRDVARIDILMGQLLTLSRLESGLSSAGREEVNLSELVEGRPLTASTGIGQVGEFPLRW